MKVQFFTALAIAALVASLVAGQVRAQSNHWQNATIPQQTAPECRYPPCN